MLFLLLMVTNLFSQDRMGLNIGTGIMTLKNNSGIHFQLGLSYQISQNVSLYTDISLSNLQIPSVTELSEVSKWELGALYGLVNGSSRISSLMGFSLFSNADTLLFDRKLSPGIDLGVVMLLDVDKKVSYGMKWINSFSISAKGSAMTTVFLLKFNF